MAHSELSNMSHLQDEKIDMVVKEQKDFHTINNGKVAAIETKVHDIEFQVESIVKEWDRKTTSRFDDIQSEMKNAFKLMAKMQQDMINQMNDNFGKLKKERNEEEEEGQKRCLMR